MNASGGELTRITKDDGQGVGDYGARVVNADGSNEQAISSFPWEQAPACVTVAAPYTNFRRSALVLSRFPA